MSLDLTEVVAISYLGALRQRGLEEELIYDSKIPKRGNSVLWAKRLERINEDTGMIPRLRGLHGEVKRRYGKMLLEDLANARKATVVIELSGAELKRFKEENGFKWSRQKVYLFVTFKH